MLAFHISNSCAQVNIKSLRYYPYGDETSLPVLVMGTEKLTGLIIEFDLDTKFVPDLDIVFRFCDRNWKPMNNVFLSNYGQNISYNIDFSTLPATVLTAHYHYKGAFPIRKDTLLSLILVNTCSMLPMLWIPLSSMQQDSFMLSSLKLNSMLN